MIDLVYCAGGNARFAKIAIDAGFHYGAQLPSTFYYPLWFADQNWKKPNRQVYIQAIAKHKPHMASVLDLERPDQVDEVLAWAEAIAPHVNVVMMIPKYRGAIRDIPLTICGKPVRLGYSVPSEYGGSSVPLRDFHDWPVHLLGGGITVQLELYSHLNVHSADGNSMQRASMTGTLFTGDRWMVAREYAGYKLPAYTIFEISCANIVMAWRMITR